ncbi:L,D-transpeptidase family protein [Acidisarcina polymorpha]|uniref:L,D-transpeptidase family protein n=1 Tax=Acidisarcina polymorpha TaxID=2211140 RepID=UPI001F00C308|nr:L,D-transpeptidase family protein [Acidisarcina polymorpha]
MRSSPLSRTAGRKGLNPDDYDASLWPQRLEALKTSSGDPGALAEFDVALTVGAMRYISDLHIGRINPKHFKFGIDVQQKLYDLPSFLAQNIINSTDVPGALSKVEPQYDGYRRTAAALQTYLQLASIYPAGALPEAAKTVAPGDNYTGVEQLIQRLQLLGDMPRDAGASNQPDSENSAIYTGPVVDGVKHFQIRHGITPDGKLGSETMRQLNTPISTRITQLSDSLERWRWLPESFSPLPVAVNIPEFVLRVFNPDHKIALRMNVVVGRALRTETPVFAEEMKYIVFRPYWNVPPSIARGETIPSIQKNPHYLAQKGFEITDQSGRVITSDAVSAEVLAQLRAGKLMVRQRPGPANALGLIKFIFPNTNNVYLHSTPAPQLFSQSRRDFSHGCIRVQEPAELAAFLLKGQPNWTLDAVNAAMQSGPDNRQVNLPTPVPVVIGYFTAFVEEDGQVHFFSDIYGHDKSLNAVLAKGPPYP